MTNRREFLGMVACALAAAGVLRADSEAAIVSQQKPPETGADGLKWFSHWRLLNVECAFAQMRPDDQLYIGDLVAIKNGYAVHTRAYDQIDAVVGGVLHTTIPSVLVTRPYPVIRT